ncbi:MAG: class I SAM-dependent methyltransferase [Pseudomonadota bacterium]
MSKRALFPSIWINEFSSKSEFDANGKKLKDFFEVADAIDDKLLTSRHSFHLKAYCVVCQAVTSMHIDWHFCGTSPGGDVNPAWTETAVCEGCVLNSRMRALIDLLTRLKDESEIRRVFVAEQTTQSFKVIKSLFKNVTGSEYLGPKFSSGHIHPFVKSHSLIRHEDLTSLSFPQETFDLIITQDVFEHIPQFSRAFAECARVLVPGGRLVFTIPFFPERYETTIRASVAADGSIAHHHPPEFHGNPLSSQGSLCFQNFGWDILDHLKRSGFRHVFAAMYWGPWQGHLGFPFFVFSAAKPTI